MHYFKTIRHLVAVSSLITIPILIQDNNYLRLIPLHFQSESQKSRMLHINLEIINKKRNENQRIIYHLKNTNIHSDYLTEQLFIDVFKKNTSSILSDKNKLIFIIDTLPNDSIFFKYLESFVPMSMLTEDIYKLIIHKHVPIDYIPLHGRTLSVCLEYVKNSKSIKECEERYLQLHTINHNITIVEYIKILIFIITNNNENNCPIINDVMNNADNDCFDSKMWAKIIEIIPDNFIKNIIKNINNDENIYNILSIDGTLLRHIDGCNITQKHIDIASKETSELYKYFNNDMIIKIINKNKSLNMIPSELITVDHIMLLLNVAVNK